MPGKCLRDMALGQLDGCEMGLTVESEEGEVPHLRWSQAPPLPWPRPGSADIGVYHEKLKGTSGTIIMQEFLNHVHLCVFQAFLFVLTCGLHMFAFLELNLRSKSFSSASCDIVDLKLCLTKFLGPSPGGGARARGFSLGKKPHEPRPQRI